MREGRNVALLPGGFEDATLMKTGTDRVFLKNRMGFIKYALEYGYRVHPVYTFGEGETFWTPLQSFLKQRLQLNKLGVPGVLPCMTCFGDWRFPLIPRAHVRLHTIIGKALE